MNFKNFYTELKRRNVIKSSLTYLVISWVLIQVITTVLPTFGAPEYIEKTIVFILILGFPIWVIFSWVYELTPTGLQKTQKVSVNASITDQTNSRLNKILIGALGIAIVLLAINIVQGNSSFVKQEDTISINNSDFGKNSIAVLAFADMSPKKDQEYFSDGISEEILNLLAKIPDLKVISRTSSFSYKGKDQDITIIGKELRVKNVLEGSIRKSGNTFRITAQLIDTENGTHIWSETYDRDIEDIFKIQDEIAATVTDKLKVTLLGVELKSKETNTEAYNLYLRAKALYNQAEKDKNEQAIILLRKSLKIDPEFAQSWELLGSAYGKSISHYGLRPSSAFDSVFVMAKKAYKLDPKSANIVSNLAYSYLIYGNYKESKSYSEKALELNENDPSANNMYGLILRNSGELDKAIPYFEKTAQLDPVRIDVFNYNLGTCYQMLEMIPEAIHYYKTIIENKPYDPITLKQLAECMIYTNDKEQMNSYVAKLLKGDNNLFNTDFAGKVSSYLDLNLAMTYFEKAFAHKDFNYLDHYETAFGIAYKYIKEGKVKEANEILNNTYEANVKEYGLDIDDSYLHIIYAQVEAMRGNIDKAIEHVEKMNAYGFTLYRFARLDPFLENIHNHPTFIKVMKDVENRVSKMKNNVIARNLELMKKK